MALRDGVRSNECTNGVCMKMAFVERSGNAHVWRSCIPNAKDQIRTDCTKIASGEGRKFCDLQTFPIFFLPFRKNTNKFVAIMTSGLSRKLVFTEKLTVFFKGLLEVCTCDGNLCNSTSLLNSSTLLVLLISMSCLLVNFL